jgi:PhzF family phenazine biosynthesis protein
MKIKQYQVDAFTTQLFGGNPAAVCLLDDWLDDGLLQAIAAENNLSETAFCVPARNGFRLRWFTPTTEVELCGHATLAAAHVIFAELGYSEQAIVFDTRRGELTVEKNGTLLEMNFPAIPLQRTPIIERLAEGLGHQPTEVLAGVDYLVVFDDEATVRSLVPDQTLLGQLELRGVIATAPGVEEDFVSRFFAPKFGLPEDPVTGSAHCQLAPYWASKLGKTTLRARQLSRRGGQLVCAVRGERVLLSGHAVTFLKGEIGIRS